MTDPRTVCSEDSSSVPAASRRTTPRFECRHVTFYKRVAKREREAELATMNDISSSGIGLIVRERLKRGTILTVELNSTIRSVRHEFLARVAHVTDQGNGYFLIGCEFAKHLTETELQALMR